MNRAETNRINTVLQQLGMEVASVNRSRTFLVAALERLQRAEGQKLPPNHSDYEGCTLAELAHRCDEAARTSAGVTHTFRRMTRVLRDVDYARKTAGENSGD